MINPKDVSINPNPPPVLLEEILTDRQEIKNYGEQIEVQPGQDNLEINYTGLSFVNSPLVKFRYRMEGLEENWNDVGTRRVAYYNNIPPGNYTFHVLAANRDGVWNQEGKSIKFVVRHFFYQTTWFYISAILSVFGVAFLIFYNRISQLKKIALAKTSFAEQLIESQEAERKRVAAELHDGLGQILALIRNRFGGNIGNGFD